MKGDFYTVEREAESFDVEGFPGSFIPEPALTDWGLRDMMYSSTVEGNFLEDQAKFSYGLGAESISESDLDDMLYSDEHGVWYKQMIYRVGDNQYKAIYFLYNEDLEYVGKSQFDISADTVTVSSITIEPQYQKKGYATALIEDVMEYWDDEPRELNYSDAVSEEGHAFIEAHKDAESIDPRAKIWEENLRKMESAARWCALCEKAILKTQNRTCFNYTASIDVIEWPRLIDEKDYVGHTECVGNYFMDLFGVDTLGTPYARSASESFEAHWGYRESSSFEVYVRKPTGMEQIVYRAFSLRDAIKAMCDYIV